MSHARPLLAALVGFLLSFCALGSLTAPAAQAEAAMADSLNMSFRSELAPTANDYSDIWGFVDESGIEYALLGELNGTHIINVQDPANPYVTGFIPAPASFWRDIKTLGDYAYIVTEGGGGMQIVDLTDPENPSIAATYGLMSAHNIFIEEATSRAYLVGSNRPGIIILDLTIPTAPVELAVDSARYAHDIYVRNNIGYNAEINDGTLAIYDYTNPASPTTLVAPTSYTGSFTHNTWLNDAGDVVLTTDEKAGRYVKFWDTSTPGVVTELSEWRTPAVNAIPHNAFFQGDRVYVSWYTEGVRVIDAKDPANPFEVAYFDTWPGASSGFNGNWGVYPYLPSGNILLSDISRGLVVVTPEAFGTMRGTVSSQLGGTVAGANIQVVGGAASTSGATGLYGLPAAAGSVDVLFTHEAFVDSIITISVSDGSDQTLDVALRPRPSAPFTGTVKALPGQSLLDNVIVEVVGFSYSDTTGVDGLYDLGSIPVDDYEMRFTRPGYGSKLRSFSHSEGGSDHLVYLNLSPWFDNGDADQGWSLGVGGDTASTGLWDRGLSVPSGGGLVQPGVDASLPPSNGFCFFTENAASPTSGIGANDVDGGFTTLLSPLLDMSNFADAHFAYSRWFVNSAGGNPAEDPFLVSISNDNGANWTPLESVQADAAPWQRVIFRVADYVTPTDQMRIRFIAQDLGGGSLVEAAIDDVEMWGGSLIVVPAPTVLGAELLPPQPNPANPSTLIRFELPQATKMRLVIYDHRGRAVRELFSGQRPAGAGQFRWDGRDSQGRGVASGVYHVRMDHETGSQRQKVVLLK